MRKKTTMTMVDVKVVMRDLEWIGQDCAIDVGRQDILHEIAKQSCQHKTEEAVTEGMVTEETTTRGEVEGMFPKGVIAEEAVTGEMVTKATAVAVMARDQIATEAMVTIINDEVVEGIRVEVEVHGKDPKTSSVMTLGRKTSPDQRRRETGIPAGKRTGIPC